MEQPNQGSDVRPVVLASVSSPGGRIHVEFGIGNEIHCCGVRHGQAQVADSQRHDPQDSSPASTSVAWGRLGPMQRRIAYDTCDKYVEYACAKNVELHRRSRGRDGAKGRAVGSVGSHGNNGNELEYVFAQAVSEILGASVRGAFGGDGDDEYDALCVVEEKALWELVCSFVFVDDESGGYRGDGGLGVDMGGWYYGNATSVCMVEGGDGGDGHPFSMETQARLQGLDVPELDEAFWGTFLRLVAIGWVSDALDLLAMHSAWLHWDSSTDERTPGDVAVLENMSLLLRRFPSMRGRGGSVADAASGTLRQFDDVRELMLARKSWLAQARELKGDAELWTACSTKAPETMRACLACLDVLMGDEAAILKAVSPRSPGVGGGHSANFCELLIAKMTHMYPDLGSLSELEQLLGQCEEALPPSNVFQESVASVIRHSCQMDHQAVIKACSFVVSDWFLAHITIVLQAHPSGPGGLDRVMTHLGSDQCEFYRLDYACSLAANPLTWHMAARYMGFCEHHGRAAFETMMSVLPLGVDGRMARQAINLAREYGMEHLCTRIQRQQGAICWHAGLVGMAAQWFSKGGDFASADKCLAQLADPDAEAIDDFRDCIEALEEFDTSPNMAISRNRALISAQIAGHHKDFLGAVAVLRRVDRRLGLECMTHLTDIIPEITPGILEKEDLLLLLDLVNNVVDDTAAVLEARRSILRLLAD